MTATLHHNKPITLNLNITLDIIKKPILSNIFNFEEDTADIEVDIYDVVSNIINFPETADNEAILLSKSIVLKAVKIVNGIYDYSLIGDLDYFVNAHGTISLELEKELGGREIYLHIEIGESTINWQFRVNGNRLDQEENIIYNLEDFCDITYSFPDEVKRGILLYKNNYQA